jgi:hypothetical protein
MSTEFPKDLIREIPPGVLLRLKKGVASIDQLREALNWTEDAPHRLAHVLDTINIYHYLAKAYKLDPIEANLGDRSLRLHDVGYRFSEQGILTPDEHHFGSIFVASIIDQDMRVIKAIKSHVEDVLPKDTPMWIRLVRDADRISALGFTGANRLAFYFGFRDPNLQDLGQEEAIRSEIFCTLTPPPAAWEVLSEYHTGGRSEQMEGIIKREVPAIHYFCEKVLPYLIESGNLTRFCDYESILDRRFFGHIHYGDEKEYEPVAERAWQMYYPKSDYTRLIRGLWSMGGNSLEQMTQYLIEGLKFTF